MDGYRVPGLGNHSQPAFTSLSPSPTSPSSLRYGQQEDRRLPQLLLSFLCYSRSTTPQKSLISPILFSSTSWLVDLATAH